MELRDLWKKYKATGDQRTRERLVVAYSPLVKYVAGRMGSGLPAHVEPESAEVCADMRCEQSGCLGCSLQLGAQRAVEPMLAMIARLGRDRLVANESGRSLGQRS